jgi:hypothetical protein
LASAFIYDKGTNELTVRCNSLENIKGIFYLLFRKIEIPNNDLTEKSVLDSVASRNDEWDRIDEYLLKQLDEINKEKLVSVGEYFQIQFDGSKRKVVKSP